MGSLLVIVSRDTNAPSVPGSPVATPNSGTQITLTWAPSTDTGGSGLKGYNIYRGAVPLVQQVPTATYVDTGLTSSTAYSYRVSAIDNAGNESAQSVIAQATTLDITAPSVPQNLIATAFSSTQINLTWSASTDTGGSGLSGYRVFRDGSLAGQVAGTSFSDTGRAPSTSYSYRVSAIDNALNESAQSTPSSATTSSGGFAWQSGTITLNLTAGAAFSVDLDTVCTGAIGYGRLTTLPTGLSQGGPKNNLITGTPTVTGSVTVTFSAYNSTTLALAFPTDENPASQGGIFLQGDDTGLDWLNTRSFGGRAFAAGNSDLAGSRFDDALTNVNPAAQPFQANQFIEGVIYRAPGYIPAGKQECELHVRQTLGAHSAKSYEFGIGMDGSSTVLDWYNFATRWNGALGDYTVIYEPGSKTFPAPVSGDRFRMEIIGSTLTLKRFDTSVGAFTTLTTINLASFGTVHASGNPGYGFWVVDGSNPLNFGWASITTGPLP